MNYIFLNLKRFDIPKENGGINTLYPIDSWGKNIIDAIDSSVNKLSDVSCVVFPPEAHLLGMVSAVTPGGNLQIGSQGVHSSDVGKGNFGAFTTLKTAHAVSAMGCSWVIIGHSEERNYIRGILAEAGVTSADVDSAIDSILSKEVACAIDAGLRVLYCIGERDDETEIREQVLERQLSVIKNFDLSQFVVGYEPIWAIGPGKPTPTAEYIQQTAVMIKSKTDVPVVYGGGLKTANAAEIGAIDEVDGGLIALTQFTGDIGFYPDQYLEIIDTYLGK